MAPGVYECWGNFAESWGLKAYVTWMALAVFILPVLIITVCQVQSRKPDHNSFFSVYQFSDPKVKATQLDILSCFSQGENLQGDSQQSVPEVKVPPVHCLTASV